MKSENVDKRSCKCQIKAKFLDAGILDQESLIWKLDILTFLSSVSLPIVSPICLGATVPRKELGNLVYLRENPTH